MQDLPIFFLVHKGIRYGMCSMFASLQYSDFASADSASVISRLSDELRQWTAIHQSVEKSLHAGLGNNHFLLAEVKAGNHTIRQLCDEMQNNTQRWIAKNDPKQRLQIGAILYYRFHGYVAHTLLHMNHCETIIAAKAKQLCFVKELEGIEHCLAGSFTTAEWITQNYQLVPAVNKKDKVKWMQFLQAHLPAPTWFSLISANEAVIHPSKVAKTEGRKRNTTRVYADEKNEPRNPTMHSEAKKRGVK